MTHLHQLGLYDFFDAREAARAAEPGRRASLVRLADDTLEGLMAAVEQEALPVLVLASRRLPS